MGAILLANTADQRRVSWSFVSLDGKVYGGDGGVIGNGSGFGGRNVCTSYAPGGSPRANAYGPPVHIPDNTSFLRDGGCNSQQK